MDDDKPKPDPIEKSIAIRTKGGSVNTIVPNKDKKEEAVFKLRLKGAQPKLADPPKVPLAI